MKGRATRAWLVALCLAASCLASHGAAAFDVACGLDRPVIDQQQAVGAQGFAVTPAGTKLHYRWKATAGTFVSGTSRREATGQTTSWTPDGARAGSYRLTLLVTGAGGTSGGCTLDVLVTETPRSAPVPAPGSAGQGSEAERDLLVRGSQEDDKYGLYSYILFANRPNDSNRDRYTAVLQSFLALEDIRLETYFPTKELNATYVPVDRPPSGELTPATLLDHYDFARARFLLKRLQILDGDGPFIVSALHPLGSEAGADVYKPGTYIFQNLSTVPVSVIPLWMQQFRSQTSQQRVWQNRTIGNLALNMRTTLAVASEGLPMVRQAVSEWIVIKNGP